jgi:hypothetical protein
VGGRREGDNGARSSDVTPIAAAGFSGRRDPGCTFSADCDGPFVGLGMSPGPWGHRVLDPPAELGGSGMEGWTRPAARSELAPRQRRCHRRCPRGNASRNRSQCQGAPRQRPRTRRLSAPIRTSPKARRSLTGSDVGTGSRITAVCEHNPGHQPNHRSTRSGQAERLVNVLLARRRRYLIRRSLRLILVIAIVTGR